MGQLDGQQPPMMVPQQAGEGLCQHRELAPQTPFGHLGHRGRSRAPRNQGLQDRPARPPIRSVATEANLILARSKTPWTRFTSRVRSCTNFVR